MRGRAPAPGSPPALPQRAGAVRELPVPPESVGGESCSQAFVLKLCEVKGMVSKGGNQCVRLKGSAHAAGGGASWEGRALITGLVCVAVILNPSRGGYELSRGF